MGIDELFAAIGSGDEAALASLLTGDPGLVEARDESGATPILAAVYRGRSSLAEYIAARKDVLDVFEAAALGRMEDLRRLIDETPALARATNADGFCALSLACFFGRTEAALLLLGRGADPDQVATNGTLIRPIHAAAAGGGLALVQALVEAGADPEARQRGGFSALHAAAQNGDEPMTAYLLDLGVDPAGRTETGKTALDFARTAGNEALALLLERPS